MKVYISGPMSGYEDYNYPMFHEVEQALFKNDLPYFLDQSPLSVCNPAKNFNGDQTRELSEYLDLALKQVRDADALVLLPDWDRSDGAQLEVNEAKRSGVKKFYRAFPPDDLTPGWSFLEIAIPGRLPDGPAEPARSFQTRDSGQRAQFPTGMQRDTTQGKPRFDLLFPEDQPYDRQILVRFAELMTRGAVKYDARNWEQASTTAELQRFRESAIRHFFQWYLNADDVEDHAAAVLFNIMGAEYTTDRLSQ